MNIDDAMAKIYARKIEGGSITIDHVPHRIRELVEALLSKEAN